MPGDAARYIFPCSPVLPASDLNRVVRALHNRSAMEIDAERDQAVKDALDEVAYPLGFFRDYDEPNESFQARLVRFLRSRLSRLEAGCV